MPTQSTTPATVDDELTVCACGSPQLEWREKASWLQSYALQSAAKCSRVSIAHRAAGKRLKGGGEGQPLLREAVDLAAWGLECLLLSALGLLF